MPAILQIALASAFPILMVVAAMTDLTTYTIPNWISLALIGAFLALAVAVGMPWAAFGWHLAVGAVALVAGMGMFAAGWVGGGDAKLLAAACLWLGWPATEAFLLDTAVAGGVLALVLLAARKDLVRACVPSRLGWINRLATPGEPAPYGVAIAVGALAAFPASELMRVMHLSA